MIFRRADRHRGNPTTTSNRATTKSRHCTAPTASNECDSSAKTSPPESRRSPNTAAKEHVRTLISPNVKDGQLKPITLDQMATDTTISASRNHSSPMPATARFESCPSLRGCFLAGVGAFSDPVSCGPVKRFANADLSTSPPPHVLMSRRINICKFVARMSAGHRLNRAASGPPVSTFVARSGLNWGTI